MKTGHMSLFHFYLSVNTMKMSVIIQITSQLTMLTVTTGWLWIQEFSKNQQKHSETVNWEEYGGTCTSKTTCLK